MTDVVSFTRMQDGTAEDYALLDRIEGEDLQTFPDRVLGWLLTMKDSAGYQISRLDHSLQAATRAHRAGEDEETVVCALLHDIGDYLAPANHSEVAAAMLRPYVSEKNYWMVKHHGVFQGYYYFEHVGMDPNARALLTSLGILNIEPTIEIKCRQVIELVQSCREALCV